MRPNLFFYCFEHIEYIEHILEQSQCVVYVWVPISIIHCIYFLYRFLIVMLYFLLFFYRFDANTARFVPKLFTLYQVVYTILSEELLKKLYINMELTSNNTRLP